jgi:lysophospholipase L1-like esterase
MGEVASSAARRAVRAERRRILRGLIDPNPGSGRFPWPPRVVQGEAGSRVTTGAEITFTAMNAAATLPSPTTSHPLLGSTPNPFRFFGADPEAFSQWFSPDVRTQYWAVDFECDTEFIEFSSQTAAVPPVMRLIVDGEYATADPVPFQTNAGAGNAYGLIDFGSKARRHVIIELSGGARIGALYLPRASGIWRSSTPQGKRLCVLGDSLTEGAYTNVSAVSAPVPLDSWAVQLGKLLGYRDIQASGSGGTGYLNPNAGLGRVKFRDRVQTDMIARQADLNVVFGGYNDQGAYTAAAIGTEAGLLYDAILTGVPGSPLVVVGLYRANGSPDQTALDVNAEIKAVALTKAERFVDLIVATSAGANALGFMTGTGREGTTTNGGVSDYYVSSDGTHPTKAGYLALASYVAADLAQHLIASE